MSFNWQTEEHEASFGGINVGHFLGNAVKSAGKVVGAPTKALGDATGKIGKELGKIPAVGPLLHGVWGAATGPIDLSERIAKGERLDHALIGNFKENIKDIKEVAPYAKMVISFVPGVGTAVSAAIGAATAIVEGQPISAVVMEAVKSAIPGGDLAGAAFDTARAVVEHKNIGEVAVAALPIPDEAKGPLTGALKLAESVASGKKPGDALVAATMAALPPDVQAPLKTLGADKLTAGLADAAFKEATKKGVSPEQAKAMQVGVAMSHAKVLQDATAQASQHPETLAQLAKDGQTLEAHTPAAAAAKKLFGGSGDAFDVGLGLMQYTGVSEHAVTATREVFQGLDAASFDAALAFHVGRVRSPALPKKDPSFQAGYFVSKGMQGADPDTKEAIMRMAAADPQARAGAKSAVEQIHRARGLPPPA